MKQTRFDAKSSPELSALMRLCDTRDGQSLVVMLKDHLSRFDTEARTEDSMDRIRALQGAGQFILSLVATIESARATLKDQEARESRTATLAAVGGSARIG